MFYCEKDKDAVQSVNGQPWRERRGRVREGAVSNQMDHRLARISKQRKCMEQKYIREKAVFPIPVHGRAHGTERRLDREEEYRIFPLFDLDSPPVGWTEYKADTPQAEAYRRNAEKFNTSPFTPSSWRVESITLDYENPTVTVETKALGFAVDTTVTYNFFVDENGKRNIRIMMDGSGIVRNFLLYNPEEGSDGSYILSEV